MSVDKILSIIVPSYNMEAYLPKCLGSLVIDDKELLQKLDVIVVNDGSKDHTSAIAHEFAAKYPRVFLVIDKSNGHYGSCVNVGLALAAGWFVKILDADDSFDTASLTQVLSVLSEFKGNNESFDLLLTDIDQVDERDVVTDYTRYNFPVGRFFDLGEMLAGCRILSMHGVAYRTELLRGMAYRQTEGMLYTDGEWISIPIPHVQRVFFVPCPLYRYLVGRTGQSVANYARNIQMVEHLFVQVCKASAKYNGGDDNPVRTYFNRFLMVTAVKIYKVFLLQTALPKVDAQISHFDEMLLDLAPNVYDKVHVSIFKRLNGGLDYIASWRKHKHLSRMKLRFLRLYSSLRG